jgi:hypothetical protein
LFVADSTARFPHYLAYFNQLVGPERAYRHMVDSGLDWGQDLPALARYLDAHPAETAYLGYFGTADPSAYGVRATPLPASRPGRLLPGTYCVSATYLQAVYDYETPAGPWTREREAAYRDTVARLAESRALDPRSSWKASTDSEPVACFITCVSRSRSRWPATAF